MKKENRNEVQHLNPRVRRCMALFASIFAVSLAAVVKQAARKRK